ncbi:hypothetical protein DACRYDRAFT_21939, partial [Dacryopinax primogenitus]
MCDIRTGGLSFLKLRTPPASKSYSRQSSSPLKRRQPSVNLFLTSISNLLQARYMRDLRVRNCKRPGNLDVWFHGPVSTSRVVRPSRVHLDIMQAFPDLVHLAYFMQCIVPQMQELIRELVVVLVEMYKEADKEGVDVMESGSGRGDGNGVRICGLL